MDWKKRALVVAIDFGTTYSGYAYSFRTEYEVDPTKVSTINFVVDSMMMPKTPTCVLFTPEKDFHSFGFEAQKAFAQLHEEDKKEAEKAKKEKRKAKKKANKWYYFNRFKLNLYKNMNLTLEDTLDSETKHKHKPRQMLALTVFSEAIRYLKEHFLSELQKRNIVISHSKITWVLTVPAIWNEAAKDFMRQAAQKAGIPGDQLVLALEPEAAAAYCLEYSRSKQSLANPLDLEPGKQFVLADCGGGTIDIVALKVQHGHKMKQLHSPTGTCQGGTKVDDAFKEFIGSVVNDGGLEHIDKPDWFHLMCAFEGAKRTKTKYGKVSIKLTDVVKTAVVRALVEEDSDSDSDGDGDTSEGDVSVLRNTMLLSRERFQLFFKNSAMSIPTSIKEVINDGKVKSVDAILLAGGFSESYVIQEAVNKAFPQTKVLLTPNPSAAVMIGAVMYGHNPDIIATRVSAFTYGVACRPLFEDGVHDKARLVTGEDGERRCEDCFNVHITIDQEVEVNTLLPCKTYYPITSDQTAVRFDIYRSTKKEPMYVDEAGSTKIGTVTVNMPDTTGGRQREVKAAMMVGGTELKFFAKNEKTGEEFTTTCDFLPKG